MHFQPGDRIPARLRLWSLSEDVLVEVGPGGDQLVAVTQWGEVTIDDASPLVRESLQRMSLGPVSVQNLPVPWLRLQPVLERLGNCVVQSLGLDDEAGPALSVAPVSRQARFWMPEDIDHDRPIRLSRFMTIRASYGQLLLESPVTHHRVILHRPMVAWLVGSLGCATTITELAALLKIAEPVLADMVSYLTASGMVLTGGPERPLRFAEDDDPDLVLWSPHDLLFHARSRMGRHNGHAGAVFPYVGRLPAAPVVKPVPAGRRFPLYRPPLADLAATDPPLTEVIEARRSSGHYSERPMTAQQLGELLFRVARIRRTTLASAAGGASYVTSDRPYPSTANLYELELYLSLDRCAGLPRGTYHYDPREHALTLVNDSEPELSELLDTAKISAGSTQRPPVLVTVTTRISRLSWMYSGIAYSTTLKHVGALQQTLCLVATAMGLASSALAVSGGTAADQALRLDWPAEVSVGEFVVGVRP